MTQDKDLSPRSSAGAVSSPPTQFSSPAQVRGHTSTNSQATTVNIIGKNKQPAPHVSGNIQPDAQSLAPGLFANELSTESPDFFSRYLFVERLPNGLAAGHDQESEMSLVQAQMKLYQCFSYAVPVYQRGVHIRFDSLRDAAEAKHILEQNEFVLYYIDTYEFAVVKNQDTGAMDEFEGQVRFVVTLSPLPHIAVGSEPAPLEFTDTELAELNASVTKFAPTFGAVRICVHVDTDAQKLEFTYRIEYHSVDAANRAIQSLARDRKYFEVSQKKWIGCTTEVARWYGPRGPESPHRTKPRVDDKGRIVGFRPLQGPSLHNVYNRNHPHDQHNRVRRERILDGTDVRTTIMLRNIPNRLDWLSLKEILDQVCFGTYDFLYLRIDFKSGCNVGYAFINFSDVHGMIAVIDSIEHHSWTAYRSNKAAEISYATIQGKEALTQKFRNSSVMQETPFCRPRLFLPYHDAYVTRGYRYTGTEQSFPSPDNLSKLQRSMDSARSVGLYPPHSAPLIGDHRTRASAFDRGTPRDMIEAASNHARNIALPTPVPRLSEQDSFEIERWYAQTHGHSAIGRTPIDFIPMSHIMEYIHSRQTSLGGPSNYLGVIGGPVIGPQYGRTATNFLTPTRGPRYDNGAGINSASPSARTHASRSGFN